jgi:hypothetical protein
MPDVGDLIHTTAGPWITRAAGAMPAYAAKDKKSLEAAQVDLDNGEGIRYKTPAAQWLNAILRRLFDEQFPDKEMFDDEFDSTEAMLGLVSEDLADAQTAGEPGRPYYLRNKWFGQSVWRVLHNHPNPVEALADEQAADGANWAPLRAGLFGGSVERASKATSQYSTTFGEMSRSHW